jgi:putative ABC transport system ATP-binding protein
MSAPCAIEARELTKVFGVGSSRIAALRGVSLSLAAGSFTIVKGPSGSGKSSLLAALGGLQAPDSGQVLALGTDVWAGGTGAALAFRRRHCGYVFQSHGLFPALGALDQIAAPLAMLGVTGAEAISRAQAALDRLGLADRGAAVPAELSGGQNQRVAIARMLAKRPSLLFCDEPTSNLDGANGRLVAELLRDAARQQNAMVMCMTHDERLIPFCDRVLEIEDGAIISDTDKPT